MSDAVARLLELARRHNVKVALNATGDGLDVQGPASATDIYDRLRRDRWDIVAYLTALQPPCQTRDGGTRRRRVRRLEADIPFPVDSLPRVLRDLVVSGATAIGCDPAYVALPALATCASAIGYSRCVRIKIGWSEPSILWIAIVGPSGEKKTPAIALATAPLYELQRDAFRRHADMQVDYDAQIARYEIAQKKWKQSPIGDPPAKPTKTYAERYVVSDTTMEALAPILRDTPRGVLLARDELDAWFGAMDRYAHGRGSDIPCWLSVHNAQPIVVDRRSSGTVYVDHATVSICGGIQPRILRDALRGRLTDCGMYSRFLYAMAARSASGWSDAVVPAATTAAYGLLVSDLVAIWQDAISGDAYEPIELPLTADALAMFRAHVDRMAARRDEASDLLAAMLSKLEAAAARLALVVELAGQPDARCVGADSMAAGITLAEWFAAQAERLLGVVAETDDDERMRRLAEWIRARGGVITGRQLQQGRRDIHTADDAAAALAELAVEGYGTYAYEHGATGPSVRVFRLACVSTSTGSPVFARENGEPVDVDSVDGSGIHPDDGWGEL